MTESPRPARVRGKRIEELLGRLPEARLHGDRASLVTGITHDSRAVHPGDVYLARAGAHTHGIDHVDQALAAGAVAVLTDPPSVQTALAAGAPSVVEVADPRAATGAASAWAYDDPSAGMVVVGLTGTNGKTTTAYLVEAGLRAAGRRTGLVGTIETHVAGDVVPSARTTPEATDLQALFAVMRERGVDAVAMEVSSHALALDRVAGTTFEIAGFTNLSQDHLDFHADLADYFAAKAKLFHSPLSRRAVVCVDDEWGRQLATEATVPVTTVGAVDADWRRVDEAASPARGRMTLVAPDGARHDVEVRLPGRFNLRNAALAFVVLVACGVDPRDAAAGIAALDAVPGRMERVDAGQAFAAIVDYAHSPDAVTALLEECRVLADGARVIVVLGCGGDRDAAKRPLMGAAAARGADVAVLTSDNPRSEDPAAILDAMVAGARSAGGAADLVVEQDRRAAIAAAVASAAAGDVLVVAGKGHEQGQEIAGEVLPFDDRVVLREALHAAVAGR
jgi:UDP-N-acetylmuramoyl-L-alanyl-D-glutamate--2,6-diaminopimelate ligase